MERRPGFWKLERSDCDGTGASLYTAAPIQHYTAALHCSTALQHCTAALYRSTAPQHYTHCALHRSTDSGINSTDSALHRSTDSGINSSYRVLLVEQAKQERVGDPGRPPRPHRSSTALRSPTERSPSTDRRSPSAELSPPPRVTISCAVLECCVMSAGV